MQVGHFAVHQPQVQPLYQYRQIVVAGDVVQYEIVVGDSSQEIRDGRILEGTHLVYGRQDAFSVAAVRQGRHGESQAHIDDTLGRLVDLHDLLCRKALDHGATVGADFHQTFTGQQPQGFPHGADTKPGVGGNFRFNEPVTGQIQPAADAFELGIKSLLLDGRLQFNASAYYNIIDNMQAATFPGGLFAILENVGDGHAVGADVEVTWRPTDGLLLFGGLSITEAENDDEFIFRDNLPPAPKVITPEGTDNPYTPKNTVSVGAQYAWPLEGIGTGTQLVFNVNLQHTGKYSITFEDDAEELGNFQTLNAAIGLVGERWEVNLRADNLLDNIEVVSIQELDSDLSPFLGPLQPADYSFNEVSHNRPRMLSLTARYSF